MGALTIRPLTPAMRWVFWIGCVFVLIAGFQLFVLSEHTLRFFAWTVNPPLTAAVMGAFYWTALVVAFLSLRQRDWTNARVGVPGVLLFLILSLSATLVHLDKFHLHDERLVTRLAAWFWLIIYILDPILVVLALWLQLRVPGRSSARTATLPAAYRAVLLTLGGALLGLGLALFVAPTTVASSWAWALTPLTARAVGAWSAGTGVMLGQAAWENDRHRIRPAAWGALTLGFLQLLAMARYSGQFRWEHPAAWLWLAGVIVMLGVGLYGPFIGTRASGTLAQSSGSK